MSYVRLVLVLCFLKAITAGSCLGGLNEVRITNVTNTWPPDTPTAGQLAAGNAHRLDITFDATGSAGYYWSATNVFEMYSPDGADWGYFHGLGHGFLATADASSSHFEKVGGSGLFVRTPSIFMSTPSQTEPAGGNENGNDTVAYFSLVLFSLMPGGVSWPAITIDFSSYHADIGRHLCIDTTSQIAAWEWADPDYPLNNGSDFPTWDNGLGSDGERCWEVYADCPWPAPWCNDISTDVLSVSYCSGASYQLCAESCEAPVTYALHSPFDDGNYGAVDPETGLWTWSRPTMQPGEYEILFESYQDCIDDRETFLLAVSVTTDGCDCCVGHVGDVNGSGGDEPTIGDVGALIDHLFISGQPLTCVPESDINQSGGVYPDKTAITIGDVTLLIDYLFVSNPQIELPACIPMQ